MKKILNSATARIAAASMESAASALNFTDQWGNFPRVFSQMKWKRHMTAVFQLLKKTEADTSAEVECAPFKMI